ncbi:MAG: hypothetical protein AAFO07_22225 [Bacteroidota bacterium]
MDEPPEIQAIFIESNERPSGLGELVTPPLASAVLNAILGAYGRIINRIQLQKGFGRINR